jgi:hypothetical protein
MTARRKPKSVSKKVEKINDREQIERRYGKRDDDLIARTYRDNKEHGDIWCILNVQKYTKRFISKGSSKSGNKEDLLKAKDYLDRAIEINIPNDGR